MRDPPEMLAATQILALGLGFTESKMYQMEIELEFKQNNCEGFHPPRGWDLVIALEHARANLAQNVLLNLKTGYFRRTLKR